MGFLDDTKKEKLHKFTKFVKDELEIEKMPKILLLNGRGEELKTMASYNYQSEIKVIKVNGKDRALVDIMRSLAHELVHHKQFEDGKLKVKPPDCGGPIENDANAFAGQYIKMFGKTDPTIYDE
jgi:Zn-dependent peptidase ImmA (M78 family)